MNKLLFVPSALSLLAQPRVVYRGLGILLRAVAALIVLFSLTTFFQAGKLLFDLPANAVLGGVFFELFFVAAIYAAAHVLLIRARDIEANLPSDQPMLCILPLLTRMLGEVYAGFVSLVGVGAGIFVWFTGMSLTKVLNAFITGLLPTMRDNPSFMGGIEFMLSGVLLAVAALVVSYAVAEALLLLPSRTTERPSTSGRVPSEPQVYRSRFGG